MTTEEMENIRNSIQEKIGDENVSLIADDLATIINNNTSLNSEIATRDNTISSLQKDKENLQKVNGNLLLQIPMGVEQQKSDKQKEKKEPFSFKSVFDEKGEFID